MRLFLAFTLDQSIVARLSAVQDRLRESGAEVRWVEPSHFHLTIKFLGDREAEQLTDITDTCQWLAGECQPFRFTITGVSVFPKRGPEIKTIWAAVTEGATEWRVIAEKAQNAFAPFGVPRDSGLVPHITLGRVRGTGGQSALKEKIAEHATVPLGEQDAAEITLMRSTLDPGGAIYEKTGCWVLGSPGA